MAVDPIRVEGLRDFQRVMKRLGPEFATAVKAAGNAAAEIIVAEAKPRVPIGPGRGGHAASSIKAASTAKAGRVSAGGKKYPYFPWLDFGGRVGPRKSVRRPFLSDGRYIWAAYHDRREEIAEMMADQLTDAARRAGIETTDG